ncbi:hypothetical protein [Rubellicoccus peritrichatus]|uniref:PEP-CTERM protein-sorting domain-containing protein n=1 Tax=Rubellicoccus peritrichatus TaxID=3080537 RepID=A0AAQ3LDI1_9BACT|nr:hypothetical protein [Puniceicoccus sp. CR14]WOO43481.1 hypothetical protein RZN69_10305 [Puniceicoccus sp. CR14]
MAYKNKTSSLPKKAGAATLGSLLVTSGADAVINYFDSSNQVTAVTNSPEVLWDIDQDGIDDVSFGSSGSAIYLLNSGGKDFSANGTGGELQTIAKDAYLTAGANWMQTASNIANTSVGIFNVGGTVQNGESFYFGFYFAQTISGPRDALGWALAQVDFDSINNEASFTIFEWAYQTDGSPIPAGAIPEPAAVATGLGALALGAAGIRRWRKNKVTKVA